MRGFLLGLMILGALAFGITEKEFKKDKEYVQRIDRRLDLLDKRAQREGPKTEIIDELNSYGYPLFSIANKYLEETDERYGNFYLKVKAVYNKLLFVKRGILPLMLIKEIKDLHIPVCNVEAGGEAREVIKIYLRDPQNKKDIDKIFTRTQLRYAYLIGVEDVRFEKCK